MGPNNPYQPKRLGGQPGDPVRPAQQQEQQPVGMPQNYGAPLPAAQIGKKKMDKKILVIIVLLVFMVLSIIVAVIVGQGTSGVTIDDPNFSIVLPEGWTLNESYVPGSNYVVIEKNIESGEPNQKSTIIVRVSNSDDELSEKIILDALNKGEVSDTDLGIVVNNEVQLGDSSARYYERVEKEGDNYYKTIGLIAQKDTKIVSFNSVFIGDSSEELLSEVTQAFNTINLK